MITEARKIDGWMTDEELNWLANVAKNCNLIIEVGSYKGRSTVALAANTRGMVVAVDPWKGTYFNNNGTPMMYIGDEIFQEFQENIKSYRNIAIHRGTLSNLYLTAKPDLIFIDGDHREDAVREDIGNAKKLIKYGGIIAGHDYIYPEWPAVKKVVDENFQQVNTIGAIWWTKF